MKALLTGFVCMLLDAIVASTLHAQVNVTTYHNDLNRTGQNLNETILTPANVNYLKFGQLFQYAVDGDVYAQPLYLSGITIPGQGVHNVLFICTAHNSVYAFDADSNTGTSGGLLWHVNLGPSAVTPNSIFGNRYGNYQDIVPEVGIIGTPTIDPATDTLYVDAFTNDSGTTYYHRIHALSIFDGTEKLGGPLLVQATFPGTGVASSGGVLNFATEYSNQRPALAFFNGQLYVTYAGYADTNPYHGWVLDFKTSPSLALAQTWVSTPDSTTAQFGSNAGEGGIWMGGGGPCVDSTNSALYFEVGNGIYGNATGGFTTPTEFGDSFVKLSGTSFPASGAQPLDWFTPYNQASLQNGDSDLGATAEGVSVERGDHWAGERRELIADAPHPFCHCRGILQGPQRTQLLEVTTRDESPVAGALDHQGSRARRSVECVLQLVHGVQRDGIARVGAIDGEHR